MMCSVTMCFESSGIYRFGRRSQAKNPLRDTPSASHSNQLATRGVVPVRARTMNHSPLVRVVGLWQSDDADTVKSHLQGASL